MKQLRDMNRGPRMLEVGIEEVMQIIERPVLAIEMTIIPFLRWGRAERFIINAYKLFSTVDS